MGFFEWVPSELVPGNEARSLQCSCSMLIWCKMTSFTEVRLLSTITYGMINPLHAVYTFTNAEGLVNYLLQDHSIATDWKCCRVPHNSIYRRVSLVRKRIASVHQSSSPVQSTLVQSSDCRRLSRAYSQPPAQLLSLASDPLRNGCVGLFSGLICPKISDGFQQVSCRIAAVLAPRSFVVLHIREVHSTPIIHAEWQYRHIEVREWSTEPVWNTQCKIFRENSWQQQAACPELYKRAEKPWNCVHSHSGDRR